LSPVLSRPIVCPKPIRGLAMSSNTVRNLAPVTRSGRSTPTGLSPDAGQDISRALNVILADNKCCVS
jgi:hypothetical protein